MFFFHTVSDVVMDTSENKVVLYYALDEFITDCMIFLTMLMLVYNDIVKRGNRRIRRRTIRYNMGERIPAQISHLRRIVEFGDVQCIVNLRMSRDVFARLCYLLENVGGLAHSRYSRIDEKVAMFLSILAHHKKNRIIVHDYIRSGYTADPNARMIRHKSWPFYHDWCEIFGKDRATGEHARGFSDMVEDLNDKEKRNENDVDIGIDKLLHDSYDETTSMSRSSVGRNENEKKTASKKRKSFDVDPNIIVEMMNKFTDKADARLEQIAQRIGYAHDVSNARKMVFEALENIPGFTLEERVDVAKLLVNNTHELELFFSLHDEARVVFLKKLLG